MVRAQVQDKTEPAFLYKTGYVFFGPAAVQYLFCQNESEAHVASCYEPYHLQTLLTKALCVPSHT